MSSHDSASSFSFALLSHLPSCAYTYRDVLVTQQLHEISSGDEPQSKVSPFGLCASPAHIGGNRLVVLCDMHQAETLASTDSLVEKARDIVEIMLRDYQAKFVLVDSVERLDGDEGPDDEQKRASDDRDDPQQSTMYGLELTPQLAQDFVTSLLVQRRRERKSLLEAEVKVGSAPIPTISGDIEGIRIQPDSSGGDKDDDEAKKRRRRSSLLRRSVTDEGQAISMKRSIQNIRSLFGSKDNKETSEKPSLPPPPSTLCSIEPLDVVFNAAQTALVRSSAGIDTKDTTDNDSPSTYAGNNRLDVLISIKEQPFRASSQEQRVVTLDELFQTVTEFWGGRFLAEQPTSTGRRSSNSRKKEWLLLDKDSAKAALLRLLDPKAAPPAPELVASSNLRRPSLMKLMNPFASNASQNSSDTVTAKSPTLPMLPDAKLRSAAVASLQRRKKRQGLTSKIRRLTNNILNKGSQSVADPIKQQKDRFAEANFDTAPPMTMMMPSSSSRELYDGYGDSAPTARRTSMSQTPSQEIMPPPARRHPRRGGWDESFVRQQRASSSKSFSGSFNLHSHGSLDGSDTWFSQQEETDELAEKAQYIASVDDEDDDGGMLAILQRQMLAKSAAEATVAQQAPSLSAPSPHELMPTSNGYSGQNMSIDPSGMAMNTQNVFSFGQQQGTDYAIEPNPVFFDQTTTQQPYRDTYYAVRPDTMSNSIQPISLINNLSNHSSSHVSTYTVDGGQQSMMQQTPQHHLTHQHAQPRQSFDAAMDQARSRMSGRFSAIGELQDRQLETLLTGLDVSESDLNYMHDGELPQHAHM